MTVTYDSFIGDAPHTIDYTANAGSTSLYADSNSVGVVGPLYLPRVYGSNLTAFEIASSGKVAITLNDIHSFDFTRSNYINSSTYQNTLDSSNNSLNFLANYGGTAGLQMQLDAFSNNLNQYAASNINLTTGSGNISIIAASNILFNPSNNFAVSALSNIFFNAQQGSFGYTANNNAMFMTLCNTNNNTTIYTSNNLLQTACNNISIAAQSNIFLFANYGSYNVNAANGKMFTNMYAATNVTSNYSLCNYAISTSNQYDLSALSNINLASTNGDLKLFSTGCNMQFTMCNLNNNIVIQTASNLNFGTSAGDMNLSANSSNVTINMYTSNGSNSLYQYAASNINITSSNQLFVNANNNLYLFTNSNLIHFTSNNHVISSSNQFNLDAASNISLATTVGDVSFSANASNIYQTMKVSTNSIQTFASNSIYHSASNNLILNAKSNIHLAANNGDLKLWSTNSNMKITMCNLTQKIKIYSSNDSVFDSSNNYYISSLSNMTLAAASGDLKLYANSSNTRFLMSNLAATIAVFAQSNIFVLASNNYCLTTQCNISLSAGNDIFNLASNSWSLNTCKNIAYSANNGAMTLNMYANSNDVRINTSNNWTVSASNSQYFIANSNTSFCNVAGNWSVQANNSNMTLLMDSTTNTISHFASNNYNILASNSMNLAASDLKLIGTGCKISMCNTTQKLGIYSSNDSIFDSSNNFYISSLNDMIIRTFAGNWGAYSTGSNMFLTMTQTTSNVLLFASNNTEISACNFLINNANSNLILNAIKGTMNFTANDSNMGMTFCNTNNTINLYSSCNFYQSTANSWSNVTGNNIGFTSLSNDFSVYATSNIHLNVDTSNVYINMNGSSNPDTIDIYAKSNINITGSNSMIVKVLQNYLLASSNLNFVSNRDISIIGSNNVTISASNTLALNFGSFNTIANGDQNYTAQSNINFYIKGTTLDSNYPTFTVGSGLIKVNGDMLISGNINTSNIYSTNVIQETLKISDKTINLASTGDIDYSNGGQADGSATNDKSGLIIDGVPAHIAGSNANTSNQYLIPYYQKSLLWNWNSGGVPDVGTANTSTEAYWELLGGSFHITKKKLTAPSPGSNTSNIQDVTFAFRINELDELELVKKFVPTVNGVSGSNYVLRKLAKFGKIL